MKSARRVPLKIPLPPWLQDHRFGETAVLPAVEIMALLARAAAREYPGAAIRHIRGARFHRFLKIPPRAGHMAVTAVLTPLAGGGLLATLETRFHSPNSAMRRTLRHAELHFDAGGTVSAPDFEAAASPGENGVLLEAERVYPELVDFGPAFRNLRGRLQLGRRGVLAQVAGSPRGMPVAGAGEVSPLGAVFALDAALHAACVWGQVFRGVVAFPTAIESRVVPAPTAAGETYLAKVSAQAANDGDLCFDIWICDRAGRLREAALGVHMRDLGHSRRRPPSWTAALAADGVPPPQPPPATTRSATERSLRNETLRFLDTGGSNDTGVGRGRPGCRR